VQLSERSARLEVAPARALCEDIRRGHPGAGVLLTSVGDGRPLLLPLKIGGTAGTTHSRDASARVRAIAGWRFVPMRRYAGDALFGDREPTMRRQGLPP
jgi:hypothetical protein